MDPRVKLFEEAMKNPKMKRKMKLKAMFSMLLFVMFLGVIFITLGTLISNRQGTFLGMTHLDYLRLRAKYGMVMMVLIIIHLGTNWSMLKKEVKFLLG